MGNARRRTIASFGVLLLSGAACSKTNDAAPVPKPASTLESPNLEAGVGKSFDPNQLSKTCSVDSDCVVIEGITNCNSCCSHAAIRRDQKAIDDQRAIEDECIAKRARSRCEMGCGDSVALCVAQTCTLCAQPVCQSGVNIALSLSEPGHYKLGVKFDDVFLPICEVDVPSAETKNCISFMLSWTNYPQATLTQVFIPREPAAEMTISLDRDGVSLGTKESPLTYHPEQGLAPNCPSHCSIADVSFP